MAKKRHVVNFPDPTLIKGWLWSGYAESNPDEYTFGELSGLRHAFDSSEALELFMHAMNGASVEERVNNGLD